MTPTRITLPLKIFRPSSNIASTNINQFRFINEMHTTILKIKVIAELIVKLVRRKDIREHIKNQKAKRFSQKHSKYLRGVYIL